MSNINNRLDYINQMAQTGCSALVSEAEERYERVLNAAADSICNHGGRGIVMLAGPSSSGKTTTANKLTEMLAERGHKAHTISLDDFYGNAINAPRHPDGTPDFETVHALDLNLLSCVLTKLVNEGEGDIPSFNFDIGRRRDETRRLILGKEDYIIVEGLHALNPLITDGLPHDRLTRIYVSVSSRIVFDSGEILMTKRDLRFVRRLVRDYKFRSSSVENTYMLWKSVLNGEDVYLTPFKCEADIIINSIHVYEPCVFKKPATDLLMSLDSSSAYFEDAQRIITNLSKFESLPQSCLPEGSLLHEFLG